VTTGDPADRASADVAVIVTSHNHDLYVEGAVQSVLSQTVPVREVIVVDDGSIDETRDVLLRLAAREPRIRLLLQQNQGVIAARNNGLVQAATEWVIFLDADDALEPRYVERTLEAAHSVGGQAVAFIYTDARLVGASQGVLRSRRFSRTLLLLGNYIYNTCLLRRAALTEVGGYDPAFSRSHEDWDLFLRLVERGYRGVRVAEPLFRYRRHVAVSRNINTPAEYTSTVELVIARHPGLYRRALSRRLVRRELPGLGTVLRLRRRFRPSLPEAPADPGSG
jgi:glycosyltransferase involved in cell wall biosynthesis